VLGTVEIAKHQDVKRNCTPMLFNMLGTQENGRNSRSGQIWFTFLWEESAWARQRDADSSARCTSRPVPPGRNWSAATGERAAALNTLESARRMGRADPDRGRRNSIPGVQAAGRS
jgi:hypothetical protein